MSPESVCSSRFCTEGSAAGDETGRAPGEDTGRAGGAGYAGCVTDDERAGGGALSPEGRSFDPPSSRPVRTSEKMSSADRSGAPGSLAPGDGPASRARDAARAPSRPRPGRPPPRRASPGCSSPHALRVRALVAPLVARHHEEDRRRRTEGLHALDDVRRPHLREHGRDRGRDPDATCLYASSPSSPSRAVMSSTSGVSPAGTADPVEVTRLVLDQKKLHAEIEDGDNRHRRVRNSFRKIYYRQGVRRVNERTANFHPARLRRVARLQGQPHRRGAAAAGFRRPAAGPRRRTSSSCTAAP